MGPDQPEHDLGICAHMAVVSCWSHDPCLQPRFPDGYATVGVTIYITGTHRPNSHVGNLTKAQCGAGIVEDQNRFDTA